MAKARDIAALAGLAGLAYAMRNKDKPEQESKGRQSEDAGYKSTETREGPRRKIEDYQKKAPADEESSMQSNMLKAITAPKVAPNDQAGNQGVVPARSLTPAAEPKVKSPVSAKNPNYSNEGRNSSAVAKSPNYGNEGRNSVKPTPPVTAPPVTAPVTSGRRVPTSEEAAANRQALYDKVKGIGSSAVDYVKNFETPAERAARERKAASGMKRGGAVKKMVKGGMTSKVSSASSRADGIASRGKTKCKMY
jgi:hypothetical protein